MKSSVHLKSVSVIFLIGMSIIISIIQSNKTDYVFNTKAKKVPIYCVDTKDRKVALSFDVSWGNDNTSKILNILKKNNTEATFFLVGGWIDSNSDVVREIYKSGNEIANHSNMHPDMTKISQSRIIEEIAVTDSKIRKLTGQGTTLFRCPSGIYNDKVIETVESSGHYCIQWSIDSIDWKEQGADIEYERVIKKLKPGAIILFHTSAKYTPQNLPKIIQTIKQEGYTIVKVSDLIYKDNYYVDTSGKQIKKKEY